MFLITNYAINHIGQEDNPGYIQEILGDWQDKELLPRTAFDEMNEVIYFHDICLKQFSERFPQLFEKWQQTCKPESLTRLKKHLNDGRISMKDYAKRKEELAQSDQEKKETVINILNNHQNQQTS
ncbi:hypothetical protein RFI_21146 [Reticulomyxa filosa]|uniref:Uncharacterized protein n=1 Tax=Reticulomyxa filosa TaxID=46433 RepID=X6MSX1_RETFI|nr:hypothetical protein RFI_21146 [Reticulomyxa filosa]|eukprot:ETO16210.1 hypothetical protein RFI_21146 [Reticulomyxa filosa]